MEAVCAMITGTINQISPFLRLLVFSCLDVGSEVVYTIPNEQDKDRFQYIPVPPQVYELIPAVYLPKISHLPISMQLQQVLTMQQIAIDKPVWLTSGLGKTCSLQSLQQLEGEENEELIQEFFDTNKSYSINKIADGSKTIVNLPNTDTSNKVTYDYLEMNNHMHGDSGHVATLISTASPVMRRVLVQVQ